MVAGPWFHGQWHNVRPESIGAISFGATTPRRSFARRSRRPGSATGCTARAEVSVKARRFQTGSNSWRTYAVGSRRDVYCNELFAAGGGRMRVVQYSSPATGIRAPAVRTGLERRGLPRKPLARAVQPVSGTRAPRSSRGNSAAVSWPPNEIAPIDSACTLCHWPWNHVRRPSEL